MSSLTPQERRAVYDRLLQGLADSPPADQDPALRWTWLEAAHVVGQHSPSLHLDSHRRMLDLARETGDWPEAAGQLLRLLLLPLGHLAGRIPLGNIGRATVGITEPMTPPEPVQVLIDWATLETQLELLQQPA